MKVLLLVREQHPLYIQISSIQRNEPTINKSIGKEEKIQEKLHIFSHICRMTGWQTTEKSAISVKKEY